jgi:hypothetical protein
MKRDQYIVSVARVPGVTRARMAAFIQEAVSVWGGQLAPANPVELCPICSGTNKTCKVCEGTGYIPSDREGDPLGPPCPLMDKGAVTVTKLPRREK